MFRIPSAAFGSPAKCNETPQLGSDSKTILQFCVGIKIFIRSLESKLMCAAYANFWLPKQPQCQAVVGRILDLGYVERGWDPEIRTAYYAGHGHVIWPDRFCLMAGIRNICCPWYSHHQSYRNRNRSRLWPDIDSRTAWGPANSVLNRLHGAADLRFLLSHSRFHLTKHSAAHTNAFDRIPCRHSHANLTENLDAINILYHVIRMNSSNDSCTLNGHETGYLLLGNISQQIQ